MDRFQRSLTAVIVAYIRDRAEQYQPDSGRPDSGAAGTTAKSKSRWS
jgi:hypothetical protein